MTTEAKTDATSLITPHRPPLQVVANLCSGGSCPTIYRTDQGTLVVQGYKVPDGAGVQVPDGEALVEIPFELLAEAMKAVG